MVTPYLGEIRPFAGNFAPIGWHICDGSLQSIAQNDALFTLLGTTYGGDGQTTFGLPNLLGRTAVGQGQGPGLTNRVLGETAGTETVTLTTAEMPAHNHFVLASTAAATSPNMGGGLPGPPDAGALFYLQAATTPVTDQPLPADTITPSGGGQPHDNLMPLVAISYIIAMEGIYPQQS